MSVAVLIATVRAPMSEGARGLYNALVTWLAANPGVLLIDVDTFRFESQYAADEQRLRILYQTGMAITGAWQARFYVSSLVTAGQTAQQQFSDAMGAGATFVPWFLVDLTKHKNERASADALLILGINTAADPYGYNGKNIWIGAPTANILAAASGTCSLYDGSGTLLGTKTVKNLGTSTWLQHQRDYVIMDEDTGLLVGLPTCDPAAGAFVPPALTTTTPFPCPAYLPQTLPNTPPY
jgi:hypothetical protein